MRLKFDRGTIVIEDPPPQSDPRCLPGVLWDARTRAYRAPASHHARIVALLRGRGVRFTDEVRAALAGPIEVPGPPELRPYQEAALEAWDGTGRRGIVALPTGSGKTRVGIAAIARLRCPALCLVPTRVLLAQWFETLEAWWPGRIGRLGDGQHDVREITVATFESAWRRMFAIGNRFDLLVVDEVHHFGGGMRDEALEMSTVPWRLGLTATPPRDEIAIERLGELVGPPIFEMAVGDLAGRYLAELDVVTLYLELAPSERAIYERLVQRFRSVFVRWRRHAPGGAWSDFSRSAVRTSEGRRALAAWRDARSLLAYSEAKRETLAALLRRHRDRRMLVFTTDNATAYAVAREHLVAPFTCDIRREERAQLLERFGRGELHALVSARVLNEGIDVPDAEVAIVVGGSQGEREHVQRVGRVLRPREGKRALLYELVLRGTLEVHHAERRRIDLAARGAPSG